MPGKSARGILFLVLATVAAGQNSPDPRGPITTPGMAPRLLSDGVDAGGYRFQPAPGTSAWQAEWIWLSPSFAGSQAAAAYFRKSMSLPAAPASVTARISADIVYRLYINGRLVSRGPADPGNDYSPRTRWSHQWLYDVRDLTPFFRVGENVIAAEVFTKEQPSFSLGQPGFTLDAEFAIPGRPILRVSTAQGWRAMPGEAWSPAEFRPESPQGRPVPYLRFDAGREPQGWRLAGYDDSKWPLAVTIDSVWGTLAGSEIPARMEVVYPAKGVVRAGDGVTASHGAISLKGNGRFALQYDRVLSAYLGIRAKGPAGAVLTIQPNELNKPGFHRMTAVVLREGVTYFEFPVMDSFSTINFEVSNAHAPVVIEDVRATFVSYPVTYRGSFESSDAELNRLWKASRWAIQICMQTHHLDSPHHQEPISDPGDYLIEAAGNYYAFGEPWLARQDLRKFAGILQTSGYLNFHTSYSLLWLQMLMEYYDYTGDLALVKEVAPAVHGLLDRFAGWRGKNGMISEAPNYMFMDWVDTAGIPCHHPPAVIGQGYLTAFYYRGLADAARVAELTGDSLRAGRYTGLRTEIAAAFQRELWNSEKGLYRDGRPFQTSVAPSQWLPADTAIETFSPQVNALAVLYDLAPKPSQAAIVDRMMAGSPINAQPYFMHFVFAAMAHAGLFEKYAVPEMHRWRLNPDTGTMSEMWNRGDYSHGWTGTPLIQMSSRILGVTPAAPGFQSIAIRPLSAGLEWARGTVPTPRGDVEVSWKRSAADLSLHVSIPPGTTGEVRFPAPGRATLDGKSANADARGNIRIATGAHDLMLALAR